MKFIGGKLGDIESKSKEEMCEWSGFYLWSVAIVEQNSIKMQEHVGSHREVRDKGGVHRARSNMLRSMIAIVLDGKTLLIDWK